MLSQKPLPFAADGLDGISEKTLLIHHDKLYAGYVAKALEISDALRDFSRGKKDLSSTNQTFSDLRALKDAEVFARNGSYLHETYFASLASDASAPVGELVEALVARYESLENFLTYFSACGMASRGWTVLGWDTYEGTLRIMNADAHHLGGTWGMIPLLVLDVYEHAYFADYGADRKSYIVAFLKHLDWTSANKRYLAARNWIIPA